MHHSNFLRASKSFTYLAVMCLAVIFMSMTNQAQAEPAMPLEVGNSWSYETDTGNSLTITIAETFTVMGRMTYHLEYDTGSGYIFYNEYLSYLRIGFMILRILLLLTHKK